jgi:iron(III) transport system substrate-binding protein
MGTVALAQAQVLEPFASVAERDFPGGWPSHLRGMDRTWYGFGQRARVIVFNSNIIPKGTAPRTLRELADQKLLGKVGIARPQFGTTRSHIAAMVALHGRDQTRAWLEALKQNQVRVYDGNSSVVKGIADGEIVVGLTDTDDVWAGQANAWPVDCVYEAEDAKNLRFTGLPSAGAIVLPNTVARVKGGPNPTNSGRLADFLLSARVERLLAESTSRNIPVRPDLAAQFKSLAVPTPAPVSPQEISESGAIADALIAEFFPVE